MKHAIAATAIAAALTLCAAASGAAQQATTTHAMHATTTTTHAHTAAATHHASASTRHRRTRVSEARARRTALGAVAHGRVRSHSLTRENGKLVYRYIIVVPGQSGAEKVTVDASTGAIITNEHQAPAAVHHARHTTTHHKR